MIAASAVTFVVTANESRTSRRLAAALRRHDARDRRHVSRVVARHDGDTGRAIETAGRRLFEQLEALSAVRDAISGAVPIPATRGWAASPDLLREIVEVICRDRPEVVVEAGSGVSTIVIGAALRRLGHGHLWSMEHLPDHSDLIRQALGARALSEWVTVVDAPLRPIQLGQASWRWYDVAGLATSGPIGLLLVDGPPASTGTMARYPAVPVLGPRLAPGATVIVDDIVRPDDRASVERWLAETPGLTSRSLPLEKGCSILVYRPG